MIEWQPIETAPKDGRVILAWWSEEYMETIRYHDGEWVWSHDYDSWNDNFKPTHWMPRPAPPSD